MSLQPHPEFFRDPLPWFSLSPGKVRKVWLSPTSASLRITSRDGHECVQKDVQASLLGLVLRGCESSREI